MKPSTKAFFRLHGWRNLIDFLHGYIYAKWPNRYLGVISGRAFRKRSYSAAPLPGARTVKPLNRTERWFEERYHSKTLIHDSAGKIIRLDRPVRVEDPERVIPFEIANRIILDTPGSLAVMRCPCRETRGEGSCSPREVCMLVGKPFVDFVVEHGTNGARYISREEGMEVLTEARDLGWVHTAWFKDAMAGRFYAICNCCSCCCIPMGFMRKTGNEARFITSSGYVATLDGEICNGCGECGDICSFGAMSDENGTVTIDREKCFGCGVCANLCPNGAAKMILAPEKGVPFDVEKLAGV
jgi:ferredoxin